MDLKELNLINPNSLKKEFENLTQEKIVLILLDKNEVVFREITNISDNKTGHYIGQQKEYYDILKDTQFLSDNPKFRLIGTAHNHPFSEAIPSKTDLDNWFYDIPNFIYSNTTGDLKVYDNGGKEIKWK